MKTLNFFERNEGIAHLMTIATAERETIYKSAALRVLGSSFLLGEFFAYVVDEDLLLSTSELMEWMDALDAFIYCLPDLGLIAAA